MQTCRAARRMTVSWRQWKEPSSRLLWASGSIFCVLLSGLWASPGSEIPEVTLVAKQELRVTTAEWLIQDETRPNGTYRQPYMPQQQPRSVPQLSIRSEQPRPFSPTISPSPAPRAFGLPSTPGPVGTNPPVRRVDYVDYWESGSQDSYFDGASSFNPDFRGVDQELPDRWITGVDGYRVNPNREPRWRDAKQVPWESLGYGEYIGPPRTPHLPEYRVLIGDEIDFTYRRTRDLIGEPYRFGIGDVLTISSETYPAYNETEQSIQADGSIQVRSIGRVIAYNKTVRELQDEINNYLLGSEGGLTLPPEVLIKPVSTETRLQDLIRTVDATAGFGGQSRTVTVAGDGTIRLPGLENVPALGLTLTELSAEANARYAEQVKGLEVTAILKTRSPRFVYVGGEVAQPGQVSLNGPTTVIQAITQAGGWRSGANLRHVIVMRRDHNWQLVATKLDLSGALWGHRPHPSDDLWLRHSDVILLPKNPGQRLADFVEVYFSRGLYGIFPTQGFNVSFDGVSRL